MTEEFDIIETFQQIRQRLHDTQQPRNLGLVAEALQGPRLVHDNFNFTVQPLPSDLDWTDIRRELDQYRAEPESNLDEDEEDNDEELMNIMEYMAWAYLPEEIKNAICTNFYHDIPTIHQILLTMPDEHGLGSLAGMGVTAATVEICRYNHEVQLRLDNEVIAWYTSASPVVDDKYHPIFFTYDYGKLGRFFLGAAQLLWNALGYQVCIESERYIWDDETTPWETANDEELRNYIHNRIKQFGQLSGDFGLFKKKVRNARRRRNIY